MMKRILAILLLVCMLIPTFAACGKDKSKTDKPKDENTENQLGDPDPDARLNISPAEVILSVGDQKSLQVSYVPKYKEHGKELVFASSDKTIAQIDKEGNITALKPGTVTITAKGAKGDMSGTCKVTVLSTATTLKGTIHMPPVDSQGNIGSCAHESVTYAQFTIAVSQYMNYHNPNGGWNPSSGELRYLFSPKFTYNFASPGTEYAYNILVDHGCLTENYSRFYHSGDASISGPGNAPYKETTSWDVGKDMMNLALNYRLTGYEEIDYTGAHGGNLTVGGDTNRLLFNRVKAALTDGNAVVICGWSSYWNYGRIAKDGDLGKKGEDCIYSAANPNNGMGDGNHAVTIVGYDDNVECQVGGITLKGAFQVLNSWGDGYCNDGFVWMMYDAFNTKSEFAILNNPNSTSSSVFSPADDMKFVGLMNTTANFIFDFEAVGETKIGDKTYTTYTIFDPASKKYMGYNTSGVRMIASLDGGMATQWALVPYTDVCKDKPDDQYKDSYLLYGFMRPNGNSLDAANVFSSVTYYNNPGCQFTSVAEGKVLTCMTLTGVGQKFSSAIQFTHSIRQNDAERTSTIYRFSFIDWRKNIQVGMPGLRVEVAVSTATRENFCLELMRIDASGNIVTHRPWLFEYGMKGMHDEFLDGDKKNRLSFSGVVDPTEEEIGYFTLSYNTMQAFAEGSSPENFLWGVRINGYDCYIKHLRLISPDNKVLSEIDLSDEYNRIHLEDKTKRRQQKDYYFAFNKELHTCASDGSFYMKNKGTGAYVGYKATLFKNTTLDGKIDTVFNFKTDPATGKFTLYDNENQTHLDIYKKDVKEGTIVKMNNTFPGRESFQDWTMTVNSDGTVSFYLTQYPEFYFGYDPKASGPSKYVLLKDKDSDYCKCILEGAGDKGDIPEVTFSGTTATFKANKPAEYNESTATLRVTDSKGALVKETKVTFGADGVSTTVTGLKSGETYMFLLVNANGNDISANYIIKCP